MTQDNPHLGKPSTTTGEPYGASRTADDFADRAWIADIKRAMEWNSAPHRSIVLAQSEYRFQVHCRACGWLPTERGWSKEKLQAFARAHEASNA